MCFRSLLHPLELMARCSPSGCSGGAEFTVQQSSCRASHHQAWLMVCFLPHATGPLQEVRVSPRRHRDLSLFGFLQPEESRCEEVWAGLRWLTCCGYVCSISHVTQLPADPDRTQQFDLWPLHEHAYTSGAVVLFGSNEVVNHWELYQSEPAVSVLSEYDFN